MMEFFLQNLAALFGAIALVILFLAMKKFKFHPVVYIAFSAIVGVIFKFSL